MTQKQTNELINEYIELASYHGSANSFDGSEVKKINKAANRMLKIAETINELSGTHEFSELLEHPNTSVRTWAAFNLIERMNSDDETTERALNVIRTEAKSDSINAFGAELWLKEYEKSKP